MTARQYKKDVTKINIASAWGFYQTFVCIDKHGTLLIEATLYGQNKGVSKTPCDIFHMIKKKTAQFLVKAFGYYESTSHVLF